MEGGCGIQRAGKKMTTAGGEFAAEKIRSNLWSDLGNAHLYHIEEKRNETEQSNKTTWANATHQKRSPL